MEEDLKKEIEAARDPNKLMEDRIETLSKLLIDAHNHERIFRDRADKIQKDLELVGEVTTSLKSMESRIQSFLSEMKSLRSQVRDDKTSSTKISEGVQKLYDELSASILRVGQVEDGIQKNLESLRDQNKHSQDTLDRSSQLEERLKSKIDKVNQLSVDLTHKLYEIDKQLSDSKSNAESLERLKASYEEMVDQLRRQLENDNLRISKIEKIESSNVNASEIYERIYREYIDKESKRIDDLIERFNDHLSGADALLDDLYNKKKVIDEFIESKGIGSTDEEKSISYQLKNLSSGQRAHEAQIAHLEAEIKKYEDIAKFIDKIKHCWLYKLCSRVGKIL